MTEHDIGLSRRDFARLVAATGAALTLPGNATADATSAKFDADYEYVLNHTPLDYAVPTLVRFSDASDVEAFRSIAGETALTTETPRAAGYAQLTTAQALAVADLPTAETLSHSPGSNPFWRLGYYPLGVFPEPRRSVEFIDYEQMVDGLQHLESEHEDMLNVYSIGQSPGHYNYVSDRDDPKDLYVAEVTNDVNDEAAFAEKTKIMYSLSIHGLERAGAEAGSRLIEGILRGTETETEQLLDDLVLIFVYPNPDGWVVKHPQYESGWQLAGPDGGVPVVPFYERGTAKVYDTNRQYPTVGWIDPSEYPGEPEGANLEDDEPGWDDDVPDEIREHVPDTLSFVEHFRGYENLEYGADLHGALHLPEFVLGLISQHQFSNREYHELYQMNQVVDEVLEEGLDTWTTAGDAKNAITDRNVKVLYEALPEEAFDYGGIWDTIGYTDAGFFGDWMAHPEELGGLGLTSMDFEMAYSHMVGANVYDPELVRMQVLGYRTAIRAIAEFATKDVTSEVDVGDETVGYVTTDALQRSYEDLSFVDPDVSNLEPVATRSYSGVALPGGPQPAGTTREHTFERSEVGDATRVSAELSWTPPEEDLEFVFEDPDGETVARAATGSNPENIRGKLEKDGEYTFVVETWANVIAEYDIEAEFYAPGGSTSSTGETTSTSLAAGGVATASHTVAEGVDTLSVTVADFPGTHVSAELLSPSDEPVRSFDPESTERGAAVGFPRFVVNDPEAGAWTLRATALPDADDGQLDVRFGTLGSDRNPDPERVIGYEQRDYGTVDPLAFFEEFDEALTGDVVPLSVDDVAGATGQSGNGSNGGDHDNSGNGGNGRNGGSGGGALADVDHLVVIHDDGIDRSDYVEALDGFVDGGGNLVLTDTGVHLLGALENELAANVKPEEVVDEELYLGYVGDFPDESIAVTGGEAAGKNLDHPLLEDTRPIQKQLYKIVPLGYNVGFEAPMSNLDPAAFDRSDTEAVDATIAGTVEGTGATGKVGAGSFVPAGTQSPDTSGTGIHVVGGLLPPATQDHLHPFGLLDYTVSFFGQQVLTNALGGKQVRYVDGEVVEEFGSRGDGGPGSGEQPLSATGSRTDDGSTFTAGQTNHVEITATATKDGVARDRVADDWEVVGTSDDARVVGAEDQDGNEVTYVVADATADEEVSFAYFAEAPDGSGSYTFGPVSAVAGDETATADGTTEDNYVVGVDQTGPSGSTADGTSESTDDAPVESDLSDLV